MLVWYSNSSAAGNKAQWRVIKIAQKIRSSQLPTLEEAYSSCCLRSAANILTKSYQYSQQQFELLHSTPEADAYLLKHKGQGWAATFIHCTTVSPQKMYVY